MHRLSLLVPLALLSACVVRSATPAPPPPAYVAPTLYEYEGAHPIPDLQGGGWCYVDGPHTHPYAPDVAYTYQRTPQNVYVYSGPRTVWYEGPHPAPGGYCYLEGRHAHDYLPPPEYRTRYVWTPGQHAYRYRGAVPGRGSYRHERPEVHTAVPVQPPQRPAPLQPPPRPPAPATYRPPTRTEPQPPMGPATYRPPVQPQRPTGPATYHPPARSEPQRPAGPATHGAPAPRPPASAPPAVAQPRPTTPGTPMAHPTSATPARPPITAPRPTSPGTPHPVAPTATPPRAAPVRPLTPRAPPATPADPEATRGHHTAKPVPTRPPPERASER